MPALAYVGGTGSGKSYSCVRHVIIPALLSGRDVVTNIPINYSAVLDYFEKESAKLVGKSKDDDYVFQPGRVHQFQIQEIKDYDGDYWKQSHIAGSVVVIDEAWELWPKGIRIDKVKLSDQTLTAKHRHMVGKNGNSTTLVFVVQDLNMIANFIYPIIDSTYRSVKLDYVGRAKSYRVDVWRGAQPGSSTGSYPNNTRTSFFTAKYDEKYFAFYNSHTLSADDNSLDDFAPVESQVDKRNNILKQSKAYILYAQIAILLAVGVLGINFIWGKLFSQPVVADEVVKETSVQKVSNENINKIVPSAPPSPPAPAPPRRVVAEKKEVRHFLSDVDSIVIDSVFRFNEPSGFSYSEYTFSADFGDAQVRLEDKQLFELGYKIDKLGDCTAVIKKGDFILPVYCSSGSGNKKGLFESAITSSASNL